MKTTIYQIELADKAPDQPFATIQWIRSPTKDAVGLFALRQNVNVATCVELEYGEEVGFDEGLDFVINRRGDVLEQSPHAVEA